MNPSAVVEQSRNFPLIYGLSSRPAFLYSFQTCLKQLDALYPSRHLLRFRSAPMIAIGSRVGSQKNRLLLVAGGRLCAMAAHRLLCVSGQRAIEFFPLTHGEAVVSRRHSFREAPATCVATLAGHSGGVWSVAFHASAPLLATGSGDKTAKVWK